MQPIPSRPPPQRGATIAAASGLLAFAAATLALHLLRRDLDPVASQMSLYLIGDWGALLQAAYVALGLGMAALGWGLRAAHAPAARSSAALVMFVFAALSLAITAYAWMDLPGVDRSLEGLVHGISAQSAFLFATTGMVLQALGFRRDPAWRRAARWAVPWALLCFASIWVLAVWREAPRGLAQKTVILLILGWMACATRALTMHARASAQATCSRARHRSRPRLRPLATHGRVASKENVMIKWAIIFAVIGLIAGALGFGGVAGGAMGIAKFLFWAAIIIAVVLFVLGLTVAKKVVR